MEYVNQRETPLRVDVYCGSIGTPSELLRNTDVVIGIEVLEHLEAKVLEEVPMNIFDFMRPKLVIFTTPNSEFNVHFQLELANGFRHPDHKFEWSRQQFKDWCLNICTRYPNYTVAILGIGHGPPDTRKSGCVSQMSVFIRKDLLNMNLIEDNSTSVTNLTENEKYKFIYTIEYPFFKDERTYAEKLLDDAKYHIGRHSYGDRWLNSDKNIYEIPLRIIFQNIFPKVLTMTELSTFLIEHGYKLEYENILVEPEEEDDEEEQGDIKDYEMNELDVSSEQFGCCSLEEEECWD